MSPTGPFKAVLARFLILTPDQQQHFYDATTADEHNVIGREFAALRRDLERRTAKPRCGARDELIVRLRESDPAFWTWKKLARRFGMQQSAVRMAYTRFRERHPGPLPPEVEDDSFPFPTLDMPTRSRRAG
jgi:hypothetical protein